MERLRKTSTPTPGMLSCQMTLMLPPASTAICGNLERETVLLERLWGVEKMAPPLLERVKKMFPMWPLGPRWSSAQTTLILPLESTAIGVLSWASLSVLLEIFLAMENVVPPSLERLKKVSIFPKNPKVRQTTLMLPLESTAICGIRSQPVQALCALERFLGVEKLTLHR